MKLFKFITFVSISLFLMGCPDRDPKPDSTLYFVNNSDKTLLEYSVTTFYPDTSILVADNPFVNIEKFYTINPHSTLIREDIWISYLNAPSSTGVLTIFLFDKSIVDNVSWNEIREDYLVAKRYEYTLKQLDSLNWKIIYP